MHHLTIQQRLRAIGGAVLLVIVSGTIGYHFISRGESSLIDCLYMTIITITTVGFGEIAPAHPTPASRVFTMILLIIGMGLLTYGVSTMTAFFVEGELTALLWRRKMTKVIGSMKDHYIVVGVGDTGVHVIEEMTKTGWDFVAIDIDGERFKRLAEQTSIVCLVGDATDDRVLAEAAIDRAQGLVSVLPDDKDNLFVTISARQLNPNLRIVAKGVAPHSRDKLLKAGADSVVSPNLIGGLRMVSEMIRPTVVGFLDMMLRDTQKTIRIEEVRLSHHCHIIGKTLRDAAIRQHFNVLVMAIQDPDSDHFQYTPDPDTHLELGMVLVVLGNVDGVNKLRTACGS